MPPALERFEVIGENIHCTRIVLLKGKRVRGEPGNEFIPFEDAGTQRELRIPAWYRKTAAYQEGRIKHCAIAIREAMYGASEDNREAGLAYICHLAQRQIDAGADFLDVNVDEISPEPAEQRDAMAWIVPRLQERFEIPLSIDSSNPETLEAGLERCSPDHRPMLNSLSLERPEAAQLARKHRARAVASAFGTGGMPDDARQRVDNVRAVLELTATAGMDIGDVYVDCLVFPVGTDPGHGRAFLDAVREVRSEFGADVHATGGFSNVSFGMPNRRHLNVVFTRLSIEAGCDSGIIDPVQIGRDEVLALDPETEEFGLARDALLGDDPYGMNYLEAYRAGRLG